MRVFVYFNLHKKVWSIKAMEGENKGRVIKHCTSIELKNCRLKVGKAGRERVLREKVKNVHAGVVGYIVSIDEPCKTTETEATYSPYKYESFVNKETKEPIFNSSKVYMCAKTGMTKMFVE